MATRARDPWWESVTSKGTVYRLPDPLPEERLARLAKRHGLRFIALFGSCAHGTNGPESDVDIAVMPEARHRPDLLRLYGDLVPILLDDRLDIVDMRHAPPLLAYNVVCDGQPLFAAEPAAWVSFCSHAVKEWDDVKRFERYYLAHVDSVLARLQAS